jgi:hypothetical protein
MSAESAHLSHEQALGKVFHVSIPSNSTLTLAINGHDEFSLLSDGSNSVSNKIDGKVAFFTFGVQGQFAVGASTKCGTAFSVVVDVYKNNEKRALKESLPKVVIEANPNCSKTN